MKKKFNTKRARLQSYTSVLFPAVIAGGWFYPKIGFFLLLCMAGALGLAVFKGRSWCDWMCPRGSFYDVFLSRLSRNRSIPAVMKRTWFRASVLAALLAALGLQVASAWGDAEAVGIAFMRVLVVTTTAGIVLGATFQQRAWCHICPMGTLGSWISKGKNPLHVSASCKDCKLCEKVCPMQLKPYEKKSGAMGHGDCLKCSTCVAACPINALKFDAEMKKAA
jgi:polyferredoxin